MFGRKSTLRDEVEYKQEEKEGNGREGCQLQVQTSVSSQEIRKEIMKVPQAVGIQEQAMFRELHRRSVRSSSLLLLGLGDRGPAFGGPGKSKGDSQFYLFTQEMFTEHDYVLFEVLESQKYNDSKEPCFCTKNQTKPNQKSKTTFPPKRQIKKKKKKYTTEIGQILEKETLCW